MIMSRDFVGGIGASIIGAVYYIYASQIRVSALDDGFGPAGIPKAYGVIMIALGIIIAGGALVKSWRAQKAGQTSQSEWVGQGKKIAWAAGLLGVGIVYISVLPYLGYALSIALLICTTALYQGAPRNLRLIAVGIAGAAAMWCIFVLLLGVSMPSGLWSAL